MNIDKVTIIRIVQALSSILAVAGIQVSPESQSAITQGWMALMGVLLAMKGIGNKPIEPTAKELAEIEILHAQAKAINTDRQIAIKKHNKEMRVDVA